MVHMRFDTKSGTVVSHKPAVQSLSVWGGIIAALPQVYNFVLENAPSLSESIDAVIAAGVLTPQAAATFAAIGGVLAVIGRVTSKGEKISGVVSDG